MSTGSFAEILREKLKKTDGNTRFSSMNDDISSINTPSKESLELNHLHQRLFEQNPNSFSVSKAKVSETPYRRFQNQNKYTPSDTNDWAKKVHSKVNSTATATKTPPRPKGAAHKLNDKQTLAMSYFINEKMFLLEDFTAEELKKAYRKLALVKHPDRNSGSPQAFLELNQSYECLSSVFKNSL